MVYRDPETGQYVSGDGDMDYYDYEFQHVERSYTVPAAELPGAFPIRETDIADTDMSDLLHRDEVADLVAIHVHALQASVPGTASAETALTTRWELDLGIGSDLANQTTFDGNQGESGVIGINEAESDAPDVLYHARWQAEGSFADSTNSLGGGPDQPVITDSVHFPRELGTCPRLDDRDTISESFFFQDTGSADISDSLIQLDVSYTLVFAVSDE